MDPIALLAIIISLLFMGFLSGIEIAFISANKLSIELNKKFSWNHLDSYVPKYSEHTIDLTVSSKYPLDEALKIIQNEGYIIRSAKPKSGRLEEFFLKSTGK